MPRNNRIIFLSTCRKMERVNPELKKYIETEIFPEYAKNDWGHQIHHINYVIRRSFGFLAPAEKEEGTTLNPDIIYTVAAFHDLGHHLDAAHHEIVSAELFRKDKNMNNFFTPTEIKTISDAIEDHRSRRDRPPRNIYGKIVATADLNVDVDTMLCRTYTYRLRNFPNFSLDEIVAESRKHLTTKYGEHGSYLNKLFFEDPEFEAALKPLRALTANEQAFRERFLKVNHLERSYGLERQLSSYVLEVNPKLKSYVETNIFPQYSANDRAHGILHIREVIRRSFLLNEAFSLKLRPDLIYTIAAYHDIGKHLDSDRHEFISAELFRKDKNIHKFFAPAETKLISEAIEDHRSSKNDAPRSTYGKLISSADRNTRIEMVFIRSFFVGKDRQPKSTVADFLDFTLKRLSKRYGEDDPENMFYADKEYQDFLIEIRNLLKDKTAFKKRYCDINQIASTRHTLAEEPGIEISPVVLI